MKFGVIIFCFKLGNVHQMVNEVKVFREVRIVIIYITQ